MIKKNYLTVSLSLILTAVFFSAFSLPGETSTDSTDFSAKIDTLFSDYNRSDTPGCAVAVFQDGRAVHQQYYGIANLDYGIPLDNNSAFYMASVSKQFTAAVAGLVILRGDLSSDDKVGDHIEDWPEWASEVTVSQLFNHTSGLPDIYGLMRIAGISLSNVMTVDDYVEIIRNGESLKHEPGSQYSYTNSGYTLLVAIVEAITEMDFAEFADLEIFSPLGMENTHFHNSRHRVIPNRVISYAPGYDGFRQTYLSNFQGIGGGGLYSTLQDMEQWEAFWNSTDLTEDFNNLREWMLHREHVRGEILDYAHGLQVNYWQGMNVVGHSGSFMGFKNDYRRHTDHGYSFLTLCNREDADPGEKNRELARIFLQEPIENFISQFSGSYYNDELDVEYELTVEDASLILNRRLAPNGPMRETSADRWSAGSWELNFQRNSNNEISGFLLSTGRALDVEFIRK